jgi:protein-disulfide isomerase
MIKSAFARKTAFAVAVIGIALGGALAGGTARADDVLTEAQREQIKEIVLQAIRDNPEIIMEALDELQARQDARRETHEKLVLNSMREQIERDPASPVTGNPDGNVTLVEFFDYQCGYCKSVFPEIRKLVADDGNVRFVLKEFPILSKVSVTAARAALAAAKQGGYFDFHVALMRARGRLTESFIYEVARRQGLDVERLKKDMESPEVNAALQRNRTLAQALNIQGTPAFIIGEKLIPGAVGRDELQAAIDKARESQARPPEG